jgi:hypothetical protein
MTEDRPTGPTPEEFEAFIEAALKVDPKGLAGKHLHDEGEVPPADEDH